ncbi:hypothetical protein [Rhizobium indicum]|uniref:Uncharacterized protein n=1 Tax=Rhizobium indicum TaxID=2583231 RepID=A0ABX6PP60_9HYPH|nr:hypothetical protein [Rhizobium indicum]QKK20466.1 hypothetical protein FFM53_029230 [Rhizobium indicum]
MDSTGLDEEGPRSENAACGDLQMVTVRGCVTDDGLAAAEGDVLAIDGAGETTPATIADNSYDEQFEASSANIGLLTHANDNERL